MTGWFKEDWIQPKALCYPRGLDPATSIWKDHEQKTAQFRSFGALSFELTTDLRARNKHLLKSHPGVATKLSCPVASLTCKAEVAGVTQLSMDQGR